MVVRILVGLVIAYAVLLRFDAVTLTHGPVTSPSWIATMQETRPAVSAWRPGAMTWQRWEGRYISDPYTYLQFAREPRGFFDAHSREPGFVFATRASLWVFDDQDLAVSWASAFFSVLAVWGTFLLGRLAWSPAAGLIASGALAIEMTVITWAVGGWRDEAFTCAVLFTAHALLRLRGAPTMANAAWLGVIGAAACLIRITSLSFVLPAFAMAWWLMPVPLRDRAQRLGVACLVTSVLVAPYLINCWRVYGDPLHAINVHADVYREAAGQAVQSSQTAREYLSETAGSRPMAMIDTAIQGMTTYPFTNKWDGFSVWHTRLPSMLAMAALLGLGLLGTSPAGRALLVLLAASLVPYAMTWRIIGDWRFTAHAYPFFLIGAGVAFVTLALVVTPAFWTTVRERGWPARRVLIAWSMAPVLLLVILWGVLTVLPAAVVRERLMLDGSATMAAGPRDSWYFRDGWGKAVTDGNVTVRVSTGPTASVRVATVEGRPYQLAIRMDPFPAPGAGAMLPFVRLFADGRPVGRLQLTWDPDRIGTYLVQMPAALRDSTEVQFMVDHSGDQPGQLRLWWVQTRLR